MVTVQVAIYAIIIVGIGAFGLGTFFGYGFAKGSQKAEDPWSRFVKKVVP